MPTPVIFPMIFYKVLERPVARGVTTTMTCHDYDFEFLTYIILLPSLRKVCPAPPSTTPDRQTGSEHQMPQLQ